MMKTRGAIAVLGVSVLVAVVEAVIIRWVVRELAAKRDDEPFTLLGVVHPPGM